MNPRIISASILILLAGPIVGCSSLPDVKTQSYARSKDHQTFEYDFPIVWKAVESALIQTKIIEKDPTHVTTLELQKLSRRSLKTDWIYSQSRVKYIAYDVNGYPRKTYLQNRYKYQVLAESVLGGVRVQVTTTEEVERLNPQGSPAGYATIGEPDPSIASDLIDKINSELRSAPPS